MTARETDATPAPFTMLGGHGVACEGDACIVPGPDVSVRREPDRSNENPRDERAHSSGE